MPNSQLFPSDFPSTLLGVGSSEETALDNAISSLQIQARDTAVRQAHTRRIGGQNTIATQNKLVASSPSLMPLHQVSRHILTQSFRGTVAYLGGGRGYESTFDTIYKFPLSNESFIPLGLKLTETRLYSGTVGDSAAGHFCGGWSASVGSATNSIDRFTYLREDMQRSSATLTEPKFAVCGGIGDKVRGFLVGGVPRNSTGTLRTIERLTYASNSIALAANSILLATSRCAPHNGTCNRTNGYIYGGMTASLSGTVLTSIERITMATETQAAIATVLTHGHAVHAAFGNENKGYICGGDATGTAGDDWFSNEITGFTYSGETAAVLAAKLAEEKVCLDGTGSSIAGYAIAGDTPTANWQGTKTADKLLYANESSSRIGAQLANGQSDQGAISDYNAGFSY